MTPTKARLPRAANFTDEMSHITVGKTAAHSFGFTNCE